MRQTVKRQQGFVSIMTVLFFILLMSVLAIGFLRIVTQEQEQAQDDDLTKGAIASADAGVEDAKRALLYCKSLTGPAQVDCYNQLNTTDCPGIFSSPSFASQVGVVNVGGVTQVGGSPDLNQRYTCLLVQLETQDFIGSTDEGSSDFVALDSQQRYNQVVVSWHSQSADGDSTIPSATDPDRLLNPRRPVWVADNYPAMMRIQIYEFVSGQTLDDMEDNNVTVFAVPTAGNSQHRDIPAIQSSVAQNGRYFANCDTSDEYMCTMRLTLPTINPGDGRRYFAKLTPMYRSAHYRVTLQDSSGTSSPGAVDGSPVVLYNVQPLVDSTGAAGADVFRRVIARVNYAGQGYYTQNAVESGTSLCKDFSVTRGGLQGGGDSDCNNILGL